MTTRRQPTSVLQATGGRLSEACLVWCRESSVPYCLTPYCGKYVVPETLPDGLHVQKIMAGQADRGAAACVLECTTSGLQEGRWVPAPNLSLPPPPFPAHALSLLCMDLTHLSDTA